MTSRRFELEVLPAAATNVPGGRDVFIETDVAPDEVYVQSQLVYTFRIYRAVEFLEAKLSDFAPEGAVTHRLGKDTTYTRVVGGRRYRVIETPLRGIPAGERAARPARAPARRAHCRGGGRAGHGPPVRRGAPDASRVAAR